MNKKCLGCGSILQSENIDNDGFVKSSVIDKADYCERCFKIKYYGEYSVLDKKIDFDGIVKNINSDVKASIVFLIDIINLSKNTITYLNKFRNNKYILLTKKDILPKSIKEKKLISYFKENIYNTDNIMCISSVKNYNIDAFLDKLKNDDVRRLYIVGFTNSGKSTFINHILSSISMKPILTTSSIPNTTASYITIKINERLTLVDTPGFIDENAIYNFTPYKKISSLYPKKEIKIKTFQMRSGYSIVINDILRIDNLSLNNSFSFYMNDKLRYEKVKISNTKLTILQSVVIDVNGDEDIVVSGLGFIKINKPGTVKIYTLDTRMIYKRKRLI